MCQGSIHQHQLHQYRFQPLSFLLPGSSGRLHCQHSVHPRSFCNGRLWLLRQSCWVRLFRVVRRDLPLSRSFLFRQRCCFHHSSCPHRSFSIRQLSDRSGQQKGLLLQHPLHRQGIHWEGSIRHRFHRQQIPFFLRGYHISDLRGQQTLCSNPL